jgi:hypothetical protein
MRSYRRIIDADGIPLALMLLGNEVKRMAQQASPRQVRTDSERKTHYARAQSLSTS